MKAEDIRDLNADEIRQRIRDASEERFRLRFRSAMMELDNPTLLKTLRKDIARMKTVLTEMGEKS